MFACREFVGWIAKHLRQARGSVSGTTSILLGWRLTSCVLRQIEASLPERFLHHRSSFLDRPTVYERCVRHCMDSRFCFCFRILALLREFFKIRRLFLWHLYRSLAHTDRKSTRLN